MHLGYAERKLNIALHATLAQAQIATFATGLVFSSRLLLGVAMPLPVFGQSYASAQHNRIMSSVAGVIERGAAVADGRVAPESKAMPIGVGRHFEAAVMFLDISGFSDRPLSTRERQETMLQDLTIFFTEMVRVVEDFGGFVEKNTGDGLMAYFVGSRESRDCRELAVSCALTMFFAADHIINPFLQMANREPLRFRITVDHGPITVAEVGAARGFRGVVAMGAAANIASKLLGKAQAGELLLGGNVLDGLPPAWWEMLEPLPRQTGWYYVVSGQPYWAYVYTGRWLKPS